MLELERENLKLKTNNFVNRWMEDEMEEDRGSVEMIEDKDKIVEESQVDFLRKENEKLKEENCVLSNKLFSLSRKNEHMTGVGEG